MSANPMMIMQLMNAWNRFKKNHPKFPPFLTAANGSISDGTIIEINITTADGRKIGSNLKITADDMDLFAQLKQMGAGK